MDELPYGVLVDFDNLHEEWLSSKKGKSLAFSLNFYPPPVEEQAWILTAYSPSHKLLVAHTFFPYDSGRGMALDIMIKDKKAPNGISEASIAEAVRRFKEEKIEKVSLGTAPLASVEEEDKGLIEKGRGLVFNRFNALYNYKFLFDFKNQFKPQWEHRYLAYEKNSDISKIVIALVAVHIKRN